MSYRLFCSSVFYPFPHYILLHVSKACFAFFNGVYVKEAMFECIPALDAALDRK